MPRKIELSRGLYCIVDDDVYEEVGQYLWHADKNGYAVRNVKVEGKWTTEALHRRIMGAKKGESVIPLDGDIRNLLRSNLRKAPMGGHRREHLGGEATRQYRGVSLHRETGRYRATICVEGETRHLGWFDEPEDAARAYDEAALEAWGELAILNFPVEQAPKTGKKKGRKQN